MVYMRQCVWRIAAMCRPSSQPFITSRRFKRSNKQVKTPLSFLRHCSQHVHSEKDLPLLMSHFCSITMIIILKRGVGLEFWDGTQGWEVSGQLFVDLFYLCLRSEICARGLSVPILFFSGLPQIRAPQGTFKMKFMMSESGTPNEFGDEKHKRPHKAHGREKNFCNGIGRIFSEILNMDVWVTG